MTARTDWLIGDGPGDVTERAWPVIVSALWPLAAAAWTDLYPDPRWAQWGSLPEEAKAARAALLALEPPEKGNPGGGVEVPVTSEGLALLSSWGYFSIHTEVTGSTGAFLLVSHDEGWLSAELTAEERATVESALAQHNLDLHWRLPQKRPSWRRRR